MPKARRSGHEGQRPESRRNGLPAVHSRTHIHDILDPGSVMERDQKRDQRFGKGTRPAKGYRTHAVRGTNVPRFPIGRWPSADSARHGVARGLRPRLHHHATMFRSPSLINRSRRFALRFVTRKHVIRSIQMMERKVWFERKD